LQPHLNLTCLNAEPDAPKEFSQQVKQVCQLYEDAPALYAQGVHLVSTDEMTGIQALERAHPSKPMRPGKVELIEFEYIRHGTQSLIANWEVALGRVIAASIGPTRNEYDFANHIANTIETDPDATWLFIVDQLNIHKSASLVRLVAACCELDIDLGVKEKLGILQSMQTRAAFLSDPMHRIRFVYIPKHTSWLNQIEIWFSILVRRLLKHASFKSTDELKERILAFIKYFNQTMAKPFQWKYKGYPQAA
jgi:DDE superfamily endonuclease